MDKIKMTTPLVEMDGDEMTRILWKMIKDELLLPFIDLKTEYYDLGLEYRDQTNDQVTIDSAMATKKYGVAVKCATITPNAARVKEYNLKEMWKSPNGTIRAILDGTVFRAPIVVKGIEPTVRTWKKPITIARHAYGDVYKATEMKIPAAGKAELVYTNEAGEETRELIHQFDGPGIIQGQHNICASIESFAKACFNYALNRWRTAIEKYLNEVLHLELNSKTTIGLVKHGITFVGCRIYPGYRKPTAQSVKKMKARMRYIVKEYEAGLIDFDAVDATMQSYFGLMGHCSTHGLQKWIEKNIIFKRKEMADIELPQEVTQWELNQF